MALGTAKRADACGGGGNNDNLVAAILVVGGTYVGVTAGMAIKDVASDNHSLGYGIAEALIHTPLALGWGSVAVAELTYDPGQYSGETHPTGFVIMTALHTALAAHGVYTIVKRARARAGERSVPAQRLQGPPGMFTVGSVTAAVTPTSMQNGAGLGLSGAF